MGEPCLRREQKPEGGYWSVPLKSFCLVWAAYRDLGLSWLAVRVWLVLLEEHSARKQFMAKGRTPRVTVEKISERLGGVGERKVRAALGELQRSQLVTLTTKKLSLASDPDEVESDLPTFWRMLAVLGNSKRARLKVPRSLLYFLAKRGKKGTFATSLSLVLRCVKFRHGEFTSEGFMPNRFTSELFGISESAVTRSKNSLAERGFLVRLDTPQWFLNRYGEKVGVNLEFAAVEKRSETPRPLDAPDPKTPGPYYSSPEVSPSEVENQNPRGADSGFSRVREEKPRWNQLTEGNLKSLADLETLRLELQARGIQRTLVDLRGHAIHAARIATKNRCGLFRRNVEERKRAEFVTIADEDQASREIKIWKGELTDDNETGALRPAVQTERVSSTLEAILEFMGETVTVKGCAVTVWETGLDSETGWILWPQVSAPTRLELLSQLKALTGCREVA